MKKLKSIPTLKGDGFKLIMAYYDAREYSKKNIHAFYIHGLSDKTYELKMPLPPHRQTNHSIIVVTKGSIVTSSGIDEYTVGPNEMIGIPAGQISSLTFMADDTEGFYLHFSDEYLAHAGSDLSAWLIRPVVAFERTEIRHLVTLLKRMQQLNEDEAGAALIKLYLATLLAEIKQSQAFQTRVNVPAYERISIDFKRLIATHAKTQHSLMFYADELNVTPNHLNKSVRMATGRPASALIDALLVLEAKVLLQKGAMTVSEIAFETGFEDVSYFGRFFKKHSGLSPTDYRKMIETSG